MIERDATALIQEAKGTYVQILLGPRQSGKSTLFDSFDEGYTEITLDDLHLRELAQRDPALFLAQHPAPLIIDEAQYAPNLFPQIKIEIDQLKRHLLKTGDQPPTLPRFRLTGSNQILMDSTVKESLAGRASFYQLNTLTVHEILQALPDQTLPEILFKGGCPELYRELSLDPVKYLNDYINSYIEKDIVLSAGITKQASFHKFLSLLAGRAGTFINYSTLANLTDVKSLTIQDWTAALTKNQLAYLLPGYHNNLNKRLTKMPKIYFFDTGLAARLQGWHDPTQLLNSPQAGALFENLVFAEIIKFIQNYGKNWQIYVWHTKEDQEIDFLIHLGQENYVALDAKLAIQSVQPVSLPQAFKNNFPQVAEIKLVTLGGKALQLSKECSCLPISELHDYLLGLEDF
jgi:predicted AAA+ superfamily ATPase